MTILKSDQLPVRASQDVVFCRHKVRAYAAEIGFSLVEQTKIVTAASELARNTLDYGKGGDFSISLVEVNGRKGVRLIFEDRGPGIPNIEQAMADGFTSGGGLGMGLGGARRLVSEFEISSTVGQGTRVVATKWK